MNGENKSQSYMKLVEFFPHFKAYETVKHLFRMCEPVDLNPMNAGQGRRKKTSRVWSRFREILFILGVFLYILGYYNRDGFFWRFEPGNP